MLKKYPVTKKILITFLTLFVLLVAFVFWFISLLPSGINPDALKTTQPNELAYLKQGVKEKRGKVLAVVTSTDVMGSSGKQTGYELTELARAYYVFKANGFEIDVASPKGGTPPVVIDGDDMGKYDYAFLNDAVAQQKVSNSIALTNIDASQYQAVYFVGGKGAMFDFPQNKEIKAIVADYFQSGKVIGAVCHGPAALVNVKLDDGSSLLENKMVSSFTNEEELLLIPNAKEIFPFLLQNKLEEQGANFKAGHLYLEQVAQDGNLVTGQNPWSVWALAESMVKQLGYEPVAREITPEENSVNILVTYADKGYEQAKAQIKTLQNKDPESVSRIYLASHVIVSVMQFDIGKFYNILGLLAVADND